MCTHALVAPSHFLPLSVNLNLKSKEGGGGGGWNDVCVCDVRRGRKESFLYGDEEDKNENYQQFSFTLLSSPSLPFPLSAGQ